MIINEKYSHLGMIEGKYYISSSVFATVGNIEISFPDKTILIINGDLVAPNGGIEANCPIIVKGMIKARDYLRSDCVVNAQQIHADKEINVSDMLYTLNGDIICNGNLKAKDVFASQGSIYVGGYIEAEELSAKFDIRAHKICASSTVRSKGNIITEIDIGAGSISAKNIMCNNGSIAVSNGNVVAEGNISCVSIYCNGSITAKGNISVLGEIKLSDDK